MISPARELALRILHSVESGRGFAVDWLERPEVSRVSEPDRRLATELVMGVLRARGDLSDSIEKLSGKPLSYFQPEIASILRLGIYQIRYLTKIPKHAAVDESVKLAKLIRRGSAAGLVNAVLRKCQPPRAGRGEASRAEFTARAVRSLPAWLRERWEHNFGRAGMQGLASAAIENPPAVLRIRDAGERDALREKLQAAGVSTCPGRYSDFALVVESGNLRAVEPALRGRFVIQDEASQLVAQLVAPRRGSRVLDLCAAPGVKTGQEASALEQGLLVAADVSARRLSTMRRLLASGLPAGVTLAIVRLDASAPLPFTAKFDRILLDVPCSGTGTLARNPEIKLRLQPADLSRLARTQSQMLSHALPLVAPGGRLVYATCSLEPEENEQVVEKVLGEQDQFRVVSAAELSRQFPALGGLFDPQGFFRTRPDREAMDGFFAAVIEPQP